MSRSTVTITCRGPQQTIELALPVPSLRLPAPGWYRLVLLVDDEPSSCSRPRRAIQL